MRNALAAIAVGRPKHLFCDLVREPEDTGGQLFGKPGCSMLIDAGYFFRAAADRRAASASMASMVVRASLAAWPLSIPAMGTLGVTWLR